MRRFLIPCALLTVAAACGGDVTGDATVRDSAGVRITAAGGVDAPLPWRFEELHRIGGADSGAAAFTAASPGLVRTNGRDRIAVLDREASRIAVFDGEGAVVGTIGRAGGGPGEFSQVFGLLDAGPEEIAVLDFAKRAVVRWSLDGAVLPERPLGEGLVPSTGLVLRGETAVMGTQQPDSLRTVERVALVTPADTIVLDSLVTPPRGMVQFACFAARLPPMFAPRLAWAADGDRVVLANQAVYRVQLFEAGRLVASLRRDVAPIPATPELADRMYPDKWRVSFGNGGGCEIEGREVAAKAGMADHLPVVNAVAFGPEGTVWVARHSFPGDPPVTDVFAASGAYLGTITGRGLPLGWLGPDRILFPIEDEATGIAVVGVFRIDRTAGEDVTSS